MPNNATAKTKWAPRKRLLVVAVSAIILLVGAGLYAGYHRNYIQIGTHKYVTEVASTPALQQQGLSERTSFSVRQAMLFTYSQPQQLCFWMKDMYIPLDMIWLDDDHRIVHIEHNVQPKTYPKSFCAQAQYVIEVRAGQVAASGAHLGQRIDF